MIVTGDDTVSPSVGASTQMSPWTSTIGARGVGCDQSLCPDAGVLPLTRSLTFFTDLSFAVTV